jgi:hypothetical protein
VRTRAWRVTHNAVFRARERERREKIGMIKNVKGRRKKRGRMAEERRDGGDVYGIRE